MNPQQLLRHVDNKDVAISVLKSYYVKEKREYAWKVEWYNIGKCHEPFSLNITQRIRVSANDAKHWIPYKKDLTACKNYYEPWVAPSSASTPQPDQPSPTLAPPDSTSNT